MSLDLNLISAIVHESGFLRAQNRGIRAAHIEGQAESQIWRFIQNYFNQYRETPQASEILEKFGVELPRVSENLNFWIGEVKQRELFQSMNALFAGVAVRIEKVSPADAYAQLRSFVKEREQDLSSEIEIKSILDLKDSFLNRYERAKSGRQGIPTPWRTINEWTLGFWPGDLSFVTGRSGVGKTWFLLSLGVAAMDSGKRVLFISCEMSLDDIASRFYSMVLKKNYSCVRQGQLGHFEETDMRRRLERFSSDRLEIMDAEAGLDLVRIERAIERSHADLVLIDSPYRIKLRQRARDRFDAMSQIADDLKCLAQAYRKPIVASAQINREGGKKKHGMGQEDVALSDAINWHSTNILGLQKAEIEGQPGIARLAIYPIKIRENENAEAPLVVNWDLTHYDFEEIGVIDPEGDVQAEAKGQDEGFEEHELTDLYFVADGEASEDYH